jgi:hypothetical protein
MTSKTLPAAMEWKGRNLYANGVCVGGYGRAVLGNAWVVDCGSFACGEDFCRRVKTEHAARRAVNRRFKLPPDFGQKP